ncbi:phage tail tube protein [Virgibacillus sp. SK37]|uniref:phage tail tube protein n=1 Tax=Virgibacillus sp. SK37 TaxID=403957 RepID=UPI0004D12EF1|nr:phage tail tube protein [Virgibacillus sp. SK37]AIF45644.1 hypothetical protein X953_18810 [Virgibacillus sp. SK37]
MSKILRYFGAAFEDEFNSSTLKEPQNHVDIASSSLDIPQERVSYVPSGIGRGTKKYVKTPISGSGNVVHPVDIHSVGFWLKATLMEYAYTELTTGSGELNKHEFIGTDDAMPISFVSYVGKDIKEEYYTGCVVESLEFSFSDNVVQITANVVYADGSKRALKAKEDLNLEDLFPIAMHEVTAKINGIDKSRKIQELTITISNNPSIEAGQTIGSRTTRRIVLGERTVNISATYYYEDDEETELFENEQTFSLEVDFVSGEGTLHFEFPNCIYEGLTTPVSGRDSITQSATIRALEGSVNYNGTQVQSDIYAVLNNAKGEIL